MSKLKKLKQKAWWQPGIEVFSQIAGLIVFPLLFAIFLGNWLQDRYGHEPWLYIGSVATAFVITNVGLVVITVKASRKMQDISEDNKKEKE